MATLTTINAGDGISPSRTVINTNFSNLNSDKIETSVIDTDTALTANSDTKIPSQKAVKAYVDTGGNVNAGETTKGIVEEATDAEVTAGTATGGTGAKLFVTPAKLATRLANVADIQIFTADGTWNRPAGGTFAYVEVYGGGGSGGATRAASANNPRASGGAGGAYVAALIPWALLGSTETVTVGLGGTAVVVNTSPTNTAGVAGGASSFGAHVVAGGGAGGGAEINTDSSISPGGVVTTAGFFPVKSEVGGVSGYGVNNAGVNAPSASVYAPAGGGAAYQDGSTERDGTGGASTYSGDGGAGNAGTSSPVTASPGTGIGAGGGGAVLRLGSGTATSGAGTDGYVKITTF